MMKAKESVPVRGKTMKNNMEATKDKSVMTPKSAGLSATYKNEKSMPTNMLPHKFKDGMVPVSGKKCGKDNKKK